MLWSDFALLVVALLTFLLLVTMLGSLWVFVPYVPTPMPVVRHMIALAELQGTETVYDLGCGDARILIEAKKRFPKIHAIGYELPLGIFLLAKFRVALSKLPIEVRMQDFRKANLADADVLFLYLIPEVFASLEKKFEKELRPGTRIISHGFELPGKTPKKVERCTLRSWQFWSGGKSRGPRIFVYEWKKQLP